MSLRTARSDIAFMNALFTTAEREAHALGDPTMAAEHLVIAALANEQLEHAALRALGLDSDRFRNAVVAVHAEALDGVGVEGAPAPITDRSRGVLHSTATAQQVFQAARRRAKSARSALRVSDIVIAAAGLEHGTTARALAYLGVDRGAIETIDA